MSYRAFDKHRMVAELKKETYQKAALFQEQS